MSKAAPDGAVDVWVSRLCEVWPRKQYDGSSAPYTSSTKVRSLYERTLKTREANGEELAMCAFLYTQDMAKTKRYVKALATFLGPQKVWLDYLSQARERITHQEAV